ncbi:tyrosine-type recombinase/integrase [Pseudonocardia hispaniensis]|uniref:Tyrosine-type recombinase/integrase n=1 Tax=Pseudonocardia hispaniensis TaxID=904933 RepID=A0ABW1J7N5_9PSEU
MHGTIHARKIGKKWLAVTWVRDADGRRRQVKRVGTSKQDALTSLQHALDTRPGFGGSDLSGDSPLREVAARWMADIDAQVAAGDRAPNTARVYRGVVRRHVTPALGELRAREATVTRLDGFLQLIRAHHGVALTKTVRTVLNGILGYAVRHGLIPTNPMRDVGRIKGDAKKPARALTDVERERWLAAMDADEIAVRHDLPDLTRIMLATGCRIGEVLALDWAAINFDDKTVAVDWTVVRLERGGGLVRTATKTAAGRRTLHLPGWAVDVLAARRNRGRGSGPVFPNRDGGWRDPSNTSRSLRQARARGGFGWVTSHVFRKTVASVLHDSGLTGREIADQLGHANLRTLEHYIGRRAVGEAAALALEASFGVCVT